jgi:5-methylcytosine-specific restriction enzyme subunit McrC
MSGITIYEFDALAVEPNSKSDRENTHVVPTDVFAWLEKQCSDPDDANSNRWLRLGTRAGQRVVQVTSWVGVVTAPNGFQIEILPKVGKRQKEEGASNARNLLINMLVCLPEFQHIKVGRACLAAAKIPLLQVFIAEFLVSIQAVIHRGLRSDYVTREDNLLALRGRLLVAHHVRQNMVRRDRFYTAHDEFSMERPENRLLHSALRQVLKIATTQSNQRLAREFAFVFADIPLSTQYELDFQRVRLDRSMSYYTDALTWARLILSDTRHSRALANMKFQRSSIQWSACLKHLWQSIWRARWPRHIGSQSKPGPTI